MMTESKFHEGYAGEERLDERLLLLRFLRFFPKLIALTAAGCLLFGGLYVLTKIVFAPPTEYEAKAGLLLTFTNEYVREGDYYVNDYTWNTYLSSDVFYEALQRQGGAAAGLSREEFLQLASAGLESDYHLLTVKVRSTDAALAAELAGAVRNILCGEFTDTIEGVDKISVLQDVTTQEVFRDVRPVRAFILAAVLSCFFSLVAWLLWELGTDSIYLPATLRVRYGLRSLGSTESPEFAENLKAVLERGKAFGAEKSGVALTTSSADCDPTAVSKQIPDCTVVPWPLLAQGSADVLKNAKIVLLAVPAGPHSGKPLERTLEFLNTQEIPVSGAFLCDADEDLIRSYYRVAKETGKGTV